jgi:hypothetical protein
MLLRFALVVLGLMATALTAFADSSAVTGADAIVATIHADAPNHFVNVVSKTWSVRCRLACTGIAVVPTANFSVVKKDDGTFSVTLVRAEGLLIGHDLAKIEFISINVGLPPPPKPPVEIAVTFHHDDGTAIDVNELRDRLGDQNVRIVIAPAYVGKITRISGGAVFIKRNPGFGSAPARATLTYTVDNDNRTITAGVPAGGDPVFDGAPGDGIPVGCDGTITAPWTKVSDWASHSFGIYGRVFRIYDAGGDWFEADLSNVSVTSTEESYLNNPGDHGHVGYVLPAGMHFTAYYPSQPWTGGKPFPSSGNFDYLAFTNNDAVLGKALHDALEIGLNRLKNECGGK